MTTGSRPVMRVTLDIYPDTRDEAEAKEDAKALVTSIREGWYSPVRVVDGPSIRWEPEEG